MGQTQRIVLDEAVGYFDELEDPRSSINQKHPLVSVLMIALMAVLAGAGGPTAIAKWARMKSSFLLGVLDLPNGVPCKDVFRRVLCLLQPDAFQRCFVAWLESLRSRAAQATGVLRPVVAIDGKTARRSHDQPRPGPRFGSLACGDGLGQRVRPVPGPGGVRGEVERDHGDSRAFAARRHPRNDHHH